MRIFSFDVFDTLLVREFAEPQDLFLKLGAIGQRQGLVNVAPEVFCKHRVHAEETAWNTAGHNDVSLDDIWNELATVLQLPPTIREKLKQMEIQCELDSVRPIPEMLDKVQSARRRGGRILFISDMYLPREFFLQSLKKAGFYKENDQLYVSHEAKASKASGELFKLIRREHPDIVEWTHIGDNRNADVLVPKQHGIDAIEFTETRLTRYERLILRRSASTRVWWSQMAGAMRLTRIQGGARTGRSATIWNTGANVVGPVLFGFVHWCLEEAIKRGLRRLYFVSRDGQILHQIAQIIAPAWKYDIECRYLFGSRQAWHPAAISRLDSDDLKWLVAPTRDCSLQQVFARAGVDPCLFKNELESAGFSLEALGKSLSSEEASRLKSILSMPSICSVIEKESERRRQLAVRYLEQEGFLSEVPAAIVDIGWNGNLQKSLAKLLAASGRRKAKPGIGFYFGLLTCNKFSEDEILIPYWNRLVPSKRAMQRENTGMFELFSAADHGSVQGYRENAGKIEPVLNSATNERALKWGLADMQESILRFASFCVTCQERKDFSSEAFQRSTVDLYREFYERPTKEEALVWGSFPYSEEQVEEVFQQMVPDWTCGQTVKAIFQWKERPVCWWPEGLRAARACLPLAAYLEFKKMKTRLCERWP